MLDSKKIREEFSWFKNNKDIIYFDSGATSLKPDCVLQATAQYYQNFSTNPHNSDSTFTYSLNARIHKCRQAIANFLNASSDEIIFTSGSTEALNLFAFGLMHLLEKDDEIVLPEIEHTSNFFPWMMIAKRTQAKLVTVSENDELNWTKNLLSKISSKTKIVTFASVSNLFGTAVSSSEIAAQIKKINPNIIVVVDATQEVQHQKIDAANSNIDLFCFSAHKIFGPTGIGVAYVNKNMQDKLEPFKYGGGMSTNFDLSNMTIAYKPGPDKYEAGTQNVAGILGFHAAIDFVTRIGIDNIKKYEHDLVTYLINKLSDIPHIQLVNKQPSTPVISLSIKGANPQDVAHYLGQKNIIVRSGVSCVDMVKHRKNTSSGFVRITLSIYNDYDEIDALVDALKNFSIGDALVGLI